MRRGFCEPVSESKILPALRAGYGWGTGQNAGKGSKEAAQEYERKSKLMYAVIDTHCQDGTTLGVVASRHYTLNHAAKALVSSGVNSGESVFTVWNVSKNTVPGTQIPFKQVPWCRELSTLKYQLLSSIVKRLSLEKKKKTKKAYKQRRRYLGADGQYWKECSHCGKHKPISDFYLRADNSIQAGCKVCDIAGASERQRKKLSEERKES